MLGELRRDISVTLFCCILQSCIRNETDLGMEALRIPQALHNHQHFIPPQLCLNPLQCLLETSQKLISYDAVPLLTLQLSLVTT
jgi:hypothetical protein